MAARVRVGEIGDHERSRLLGLVRRGRGSVVSWRRAQIVLLSAQAMDVPEIARVTFTGEDRGRDVIDNLAADGFESLYPRYRGGRPPVFGDAQREQIEAIALSRPQDHGLAFSTWSLRRPAEQLVAERVVEDIGHEALRILLRDAGLSFQRVKTWKQSNDPDYEAKKARIVRLYAIAEGKIEPGPDDPVELICLDEFGPLNLRAPPRPPVGVPLGQALPRRWPPRAAPPATRDLQPPARRQAPVRRLGAARRPALRPHQAPQAPRRVPHVPQVRRLAAHPPEVRIAIVPDNFSAHLTTKTDTRVGDYAAADNIELACTPSNAGWLNRIEPQLTGLRYFALDGTDHASHAEQGRMISGYIRWRNRHPNDRRHRDVVDRAKVA